MLGRRLAFEAGSDNQSPSLPSHEASAIISSHHMQTITTRRNALVARFRDVARGDEDDVLLLDGVHLVGDAIAAGLRHPPGRRVGRLPSTARRFARSSRRSTGRRRARLASATSMVMDAVSPVRSASGIVAIADRPAHGSRTDLCDRRPADDHRRRCPGPGQPRRHRPRRRGGRRDRRGGRREERESVRMEGAARIDGERPAPADCHSSRDRGGHRRRATARLSNRGDGPARRRRLRRRRPSRADRPAHRRRRRGPLSRAHCGRRTSASAFRCGRRSNR